MGRARRRAPYAALAAWAIATAAPSETCGAQEDARGFFAGKTITYVVGTTPGGGYDTYARLVAKHMKRHLPVADIVVKNVPGAGHIIGANAVYAAEPDGLTIGIFNVGLIYAQLLRREGIQFDLRRVGWLGKAGGEPRVLLVASATPYRSLDDVRRAGKPLLLGASGLGDAGYNDMSLLAHALDLDLKYIFGMGTREAQLKMMRGEVEALFGSYSSNRRFLEEGHGRMLFGVGVGEIAPELPDARDLVVTDEGKAIVALVRSQAGLLRATGGPPGIPAERLEVLRGAYLAALADPKLIDEARKFGIPILPMDGETVARRISEALDQPPRVVSLFASIMDVAVVTMNASTALRAVTNGGKVVSFDASGAPVDVKISGSRTVVTLDDKPAHRSALRAGMPCTIEYDAAAEYEATSIACRSSP